MVVDNIKDIVKGHAFLVYIIGGGLAVYELEAVDGNRYSITIDMTDKNDVGSEARFLPIYEKAITLMRWIRRANEDGTLIKLD